MTEESSQEWRHRRESTLALWGRNKTLTSTSTLRTEPADSATKTAEDGADGSTTAARILDLSTIGLPNLLDDLPARCSRLACEALGNG